MFMTKGKAGRVTTASCRAPRVASPRPVWATRTPIWWRRAEAGGHARARASEHRLLPVQPGRDAHAAAGAAQYTGHVLLCVQRLEGLHESSSQLFNAASTTSIPPPSQKPVKNVPSKRKAHKVDNNGETLFESPTNKARSALGA
ncbi:hypothetical protein PR001_g10128 [Phytophthora rubi]|uniref:Uncharacterized protein n=1 Tax=Phytophthora rubi TaxID=129364 RepID=A0A6A3MWA8_9STRA|nr:hypothetical protein PR001_g10128 [Phytophthora rubi]